MLDSVPYPLPDCSATAQECERGIERMIGIIQKMRFGMIHVQGL